MLEGRRTTDEESVSKLRGNEGETIAAETAISSTANLRRWAALWLFVGFAALYITLTRGHFISTDEIGVYQATASLWERGNLSVETTDANNRVLGRGGLYYGIVNAGQSVAALPLYGMGKLAEHLLSGSEGRYWRDLLAGPLIARNEHVVWGGRTEIFFVNLFNTFPTALLCALFFLFSMRTGASARWSFISTLLLGLTSYVAPLSSGFFQHSSETLLIFAAFYFLFRDSQEPAWQRRAAAGAAIVLMIQFRFASAVAIPALLIYHGIVLWRRNRPAITRSLSEARILLGSIGIAFAAHAAVQWWKFGTIRFTGNYAAVQFDEPLLVSLRGFLISPGDSIFLFTPLLILVPWTFHSFSKRFPAETTFVLLTVATSLYAFGKNHFWHGMWCFGPRYLTSLVPLLLLPLARWMESAGKKVWVVAPLALAGLWMQVIHFAVNFWIVALHDGYLDYKPEFGFLFHLRSSQILAHSRALLAGDSRVDMWLVNVWRAAGLFPVLLLGGPLLAIAAVAIWKLRSLVLGIDSPQSKPERRPLRLRHAAIAAIAIVAATGIGIATDRYAAANAPTDEALMSQGLEALYTNHDYSAAEAAFREVLDHTPAHYGANFQLAYALDLDGRSAEAVPYWVKVLGIADNDRDAKTGAAAFARLRAELGLSDEGLMALALHERLVLNDPLQAAAYLRIILARTPTHYGATYQLAAALDAAGQESEARPVWQRMLVLATSVHDEAIAAAVRQRLEQADSGGSK